MLCSSYSGDTEETLACFDAAEALGARRIVASTGGPLVDGAREAGLPVVGLPGIFQPRAAVAYMFAVAAEVAALAGAAPAHPHRDRRRRRLPRGRVRGPAGPRRRGRRPLEGADPGRLRRRPDRAGGAALEDPGQRERQAARLLLRAARGRPQRALRLGRAPTHRLAAVFLEDRDQHPRERRRFELTAAAVAATDATAVRVETAGETRVARLLWATMLGDLVSLELATRARGRPAPGRGDRALQGGDGAAMRAMVLAAGLGTRLRPITYEMPKPMVPVLNRPVMEHIVRLLARHGFTETIANLHWFPELIEAHFGDGCGSGSSSPTAARSSCSGTSGGVRNAADFLGDSFLVISGDALTDIDLAAMREFHESHDGIATLATKRVADTSQFGVAITGADGRIQGFQEKPDPAEALSDLANCGIYMFRSEIFDFFPEPGTSKAAGPDDPAGFADWAMDVFPRLLEGDVPFYSHEIDAYWNDIGNLEELRAGHPRRAQRRGRGRARGRAGRGLPQRLAGRRGGRAEGPGPARRRLRDRRRRSHRRALGDRRRRPGRRRQPPARSDRPAGCRDPRRLGPDRRDRRSPRLSAPFATLL